MWMMNPLLPKIPVLAKNIYPPANHAGGRGRVKLRLAGNI
jgi:hypothetical protein